MCGIVGFLDQQQLPENAGDIIRSMAEQIKHRGPDADGYWSSARHGIALGHRRLSIHDLSAHGSQPMVSKSGQTVVVFNGEIYNFKTIRDELTAVGIPFSSDCDTEVLLEATEYWGAAEAVKRFNGMFSYAAWSVDTGTLSLFRDRMGEKPLYYSFTPQRLVFASELGSLVRHPDVQQVVDRDVLALYLRYGYVPTPYAIYQGVNKLEPGHGLTVQRQADGALSLDKAVYWSVEPFLAEAANRDIQPEQAVDQLESLLLDSVAKQMSADVPLGAFLSGGIDSSTVVALMQAQSERPVQTFSIGFDEKGYNEATYAKEVADKLGTEHTQLYVSKEMALDTLSTIPTIYDEPFADSSQIPTLIVSQLARRQVTVSLSGDGGDELFYGYSRYTSLINRWAQLNKVPARKMVGKTMAGLGALWQSQSPKIHYSTFDKIALWLSADNGHDYYQYNMSHFHRPADFIIDSSEAKCRIGYAAKMLEHVSFNQSMSVVDMQSYLPDDILVKLDRASMAVSLESRVPLLDHRIVEFAASLPLSIKYKDGQPKWPLKQVLYRYLPQAMMERPKMGFGIPLDQWLRTALRPWAEALLDANRLTQEGFFNVGAVRAMWQAHIEAKQDHGSRLWNILMFQAWYEAQQAG